MAQITKEEKNSEQEVSSKQNRKKNDKNQAGTAVSTNVEPDIATEAVPAEPSEVTVSIQSVMGGSITTDEIIARVHAAAPDAVEIYVKTEENKAYYVGKQSRGFVVLWE